MRSASLFMGILFSVGGLPLTGQVLLQKIDSVTTLPTAFLTRIEHKYAPLDVELTKKTEKYLARLQKVEQRIHRKIAKWQGKAEQSFGKADQQYSALTGKIQSVSKMEPPGATGMYIPLIDSVKCSLQFLSGHPELVKSLGDTKTKANTKIGASLEQVKQLQSRLQVTGEVKAFIAERKEQLRLRVEELKNNASNYSRIWQNVSKDLRTYQQQAYYYSAQVAEYKQLLNDPDRIIQKGLSVMRKLPQFQQFIKAHGELAGLFALPSDYGAAVPIAGLQTRAGTQQLIQSQLDAGGPNGMQIMQQNLQAAQAGLSTFKNKLQKMGNGSADMPMPDFKPNGQKTKSIWQRLEYGTNLQTVKNRFFPVTVDLAFSVGYKLNNKSTVGLGASYKLGCGNDIRDIRFSNQGVGLRSFIDLKLKGSFYASGGLEYNYQPLKSDSINSLHTDALNPWQKSGLVGVSKIISMNSKFFKKTKLQLLFDFLSYGAVPRTQPIKFRVGYQFK